MPVQPVQSHFEQGAAENEIEVQLEAQGDVAASDATERSQPDTLEKNISEQELDTAKESIHPAMTEAASEAARPDADHSENHHEKDTTVGHSTARSPEPSEDQRDTETTAKDSKIRSAEPSDASEAEDDDEIPVHRKKKLRASEFVVCLLLK